MLTEKRITDAPTYFIQRITDLHSWRAISRRRVSSFHESKMLYDLNVTWSSTNNADLQRTISFLSELKYSVLALTHHINGPIPSQISNPIPTSLPFKSPHGTTILRRCTLTISDPSLNHRLPALSQAYDILAMRPTNEKAFLLACTSLDNFSIISLDLTLRYPFHFRPKPFMTAIRRGIRFEICYAQAVQDGGADKRRNFISNTLAIVRATRGRGLIVSSEARSVLGVRAPADVQNLLNVWGMEQERAKEALTVTPRSVVANERMRRTSHRGVIDVVEGGERDIIDATTQESQTKAENSRVVTKGNSKKAKRGIDDTEKDQETPTPPMSKRQAKRLKRAALMGENTESSSASLQSTPTPQARAEGKLGVT